MRQTHSTPKQEKPPRAKPMEPLEEGALGKNANKRGPRVFFSEREIAYLLERCRELIQAGLNDSQISKKLGQELGKPHRSADVQVQNLRKEGKIPENPNNQDQKPFTPEEEALIVKRHSELIQAGLKDSQISKKLGQELVRSAGSAAQKVRNLRKEGKIPENPNNRRFTHREEVLFRQRCKELIQAGLKDSQISKKLGEELVRSASSIKDKMHKLRKRKKLPENPNNQEQRPFTPEEEALFIQSGRELIQAGLKDRQLSKKLGAQFGRPASSVSAKVRNLRKEGKIPENPNNQGHNLFTPDEEVLFKQRCKELIQAGLNDFQLSKKLGEQFGRSVGSVDGKVRNLRKEGKIPENPNHQGRTPFTPEEEALFRQRCKELIQAGLNDRQLSKKLGEEFGRLAHSVCSKVESLRKKGKIPENPNNRNLKRLAPAEETLFIQKYNGLIQAGLKDPQLSEKLAEEFGRSVSSAINIIWKLRKEGKISSNPNRQLNAGNMSEDERGAAVQGVLDVLNEMGGSK